MGQSIEKRLSAIRELIEEKAVEDQAMLVQLLQTEQAITTNQAQVSRDLKRLGVSKKKIGQKMVYDLSPTDQTKELLRLAIREVLHNETLIVIKTMPGLADFVGDYLDAQKESDLMGTIAGENMLFATPISCQAIKQTYKTVCKLLYYKQKS